MVTAKIKQLRAYAISQSLFPPATLKAAIDRLSFVQADPIRSPARAQDLILRHRVRGYRSGDLERRYRSLGLEEDVLYAYGFVPRTVWRLLHWRNTNGLPNLERKVLESVRRKGETHPRELAESFGRKRVRNAWGGFSNSTKRALESLHYRGLLRIAGRKEGVRIYQATIAQTDSPTPRERSRKLILILAKVFAPMPEASLRTRIAAIRRWLPCIPDARVVLDDLFREGRLERQSIDGRSYVWPSRGRRLEEVPRCVRFLAPFDPLVWDRKRFEHFWGWPYRFEAYTPPAKRLRGYYAMPLLWEDRVIGWVNVRVHNGKMDIKLGFVEKRPRSRRFRAELELEVARMKTFLQGKEGSR